MCEVSPDARIIALGRINGQAKLFDSHTGQIHEPQELAHLIFDPTLPGGYIAGHNLFPLIADCQSAHASTPGFVAQIAGVKRHLLRGTKRVAIGVFLPYMVGFRDPNRHRKARYFHCMEFTELFSGKVSSDLLEVVATAKQCLQVLQSRGVTRWTPSKGGLAARMLKASPEWEKGRHGAPRFVNDIGRLHLPGNHYGLGVPTKQIVKRALYLDQDGAHHAAAMTAPIPHPHHIRERGNAHALAEGKITPWAASNSPLLAELQSEHYGLFAALVTIGNVPNKLAHMVPKWMQLPGTRIVYLHSNEWWYLTLQWVQLNYVVAAWTATVKDPAIPEYAEWAKQQAADFRPLKPTLLAAYGMLAVKHDNVSVTYWGGPDVAQKGLKTSIPVAGAMRELQWVRQPDAKGPSTAHVVARGIIEAETRLRSLRYAWELHYAGLRVLSVYVDGIMVEGDRVPLLPPGWSVKTQLTDLMFYASNSYVSREEEKLPGIPKDDRDRRRQARSLPALVRARERAL